MLSRSATVPVTLCALRRASGELEPSRRRFATPGHLARPWITAKRHPPDIAEARRTMARSQQAHFLRSLAADHAAAGHLQLPVDEYRGLRAEAVAEPEGPSRRALLGRAAALGLGAAALGTGVDLARPTKAHADVTAVPTKNGGTSARIAIIGAGISGPNAALTPADKG